MKCSATPPQSPTGFFCTFFLSELSVQSSFLSSLGHGHENTSFTVISEPYAIKSIEMFRHATSVPYWLLLFISLSELSVQSSFLSSLGHGHENSSFTVISERYFPPYMP
jgi:hypothetical protein